ncbi:IclR family transcriptional regulator [Ornithinimicrobium sp. LYQ92]|uniref:IclR family transcriptional regulator n=1 Tax=Serinicoccus sp. LYQ92 TaxID=3378798 RepID=UPI0038545DD8
MRTERAEGSGVVQSVHRALTILGLLARDGELGVSELASALGVHRSTASRLVAALAEHEMVQQPEVRGRVRLGPGVLRLAGAANARLDLVQEARPVCRVLAARTNETVNVAVLADRSALYVDQVIGSSTITAYNWVGQHVPLHATANGRILVSELPPSVRLGAWGSAPAGYTEHTVTDPATLEELVLRARAQGYALVRDELDVGLTALAAPVRNAHGELCASISVSGPTFRIGPARVGELVPLLLRAAEDVSARLGWHGTSSVSGAGRPAASP